jgi:hypothetical protein
VVDVIEAQGISVLSPQQVCDMCYVLNVPIDANTVINSGIDGNKLSKSSKSPVVLAKQVNCTLGVGMYMCGIIQQLNSGKQMPASYYATTQQTRTLLARHQLTMLQPLFDQWGITDGVLPYVNAEVLGHLNEQVLECSDQLTAAIAEHVSARRHEPSGAAGSGMS